MKHSVVFGLIVLAALAALFTAERRKVDVQPGPAAMLYLVADSEQELTRMPVSFTRMSDPDEIAVGNEMARSYESGREEKKSPEVAQIERYVNEVGARLAQRAHRKLPYRFHYVPDASFINAFALPGGHVFIGAGLLSYMDSEDELAAVLGHELEHVDHYHCAERVQREQAMRKIPFGGLVSIPIEVFEAGYSKEQEMEADREGTRLAVEAGYSASGALRMFETFQRLYEQAQGRAKSPEGELTQVAQETLEGYFRSHPLASERMDQINTLLATEHWPVRAERDLKIAYFFWADKARVALEEHRYSQAEQLAMHSLKMNPDQPSALETLARAQALQADFVKAAESYRKLFDAEPTIQRADAFALALAAADRNTGLERFQSWAEMAKTTASLDVPAAGLALLIGRKEQAAILAERAQKQNKADDIARLAWWHYLAGDSQRASELFADAIQRHPGVGDWATENAWAQIDLNRLADALQSLEGGEGPVQRTDRAMARAVAFWQAKEPDQALEQFESMIDGQPEWSNAAWVKAMYSPMVTTAVEQMKAERELRRKAQVALGR